MKLLIPRPKLIRPIRGREEADATVFSKDSKLNRLPEVYKQHWVEMNVRWKNGNWCHERPNKRKFCVDHETGVWTKLPSLPIPIMYPLEADKGLWGGEGVVAGYYLTKNPDFPPHSNIWNPQLMKLIMKSRILGRRYAILMTRRTVSQIEKCEGFDEYILMTHPFDLYSRFGIELKKEMLRALNEMSAREFDLNESDRQTLDKFRKFMEPNEEAIEWMGLSLTEARKKLEAQDRKKVEESIVPLKEVYSKQLEEAVLKARSNGISWDAIRDGISETGYGGVSK